MGSHFSLLIVSIFVTGLLVIGCEQPQVTGVDTDHLREGGELEPQFRRVFTGRDSFGVSLNAKISGTVEDSDTECWTLTGSGQVTHLGKASVSNHSACVSENTGSKTVEGTFTYTGQTGGVIEGSYEGTLEEGTLDAHVTIEEVIDLPSVKAEPEETPPGGGTMTGRLTDKAFRYTIEGWLFQRSR